jgi:hypothetical protein
MLTYYAGLKIDDLEGWTTEELSYMKRHGVKEVLKEELGRRQKLIRSFVEKLKAKRGLYEKIFT